MTPAQRAAINALLEWSTIPQSTLSYASTMVEEAEKQFFEPKYRTKCPDELLALGVALTAVYDAFGWQPINPDGTTHPPLGTAGPVRRGFVSRVVHGGRALWRRLSGAPTDDDEA